VDRIVTAGWRGPLDVAESVRRWSQAQHVSVAAIDRSGAGARLLAIAGTDTLTRDARVLAEQSTRLLAATRGQVWASPDFAREPRFVRIIDQLSKATGYRAGCSVPIRVGGRPAGVVVLSSTTTRTWDGVTGALAAQEQALARALGLGTVADPTLSGRERDLLRALDTGRSYQQIATAFGITVHTVRGYAKSLFTKLDAHSRGEAVHEARRRGLL
jgi:DNA-binding CsgD family transcriptional regulator